MVSIVLGQSIEQSFTFRPIQQGRRVLHRIGRLSGVDPVAAAKAGHWSDPNLPLPIYAHAETDEADVRTRLRTIHVQEDPAQTHKQHQSKKE